jgi:type IV pilus assembly protein PilC
MPTYTYTALTREGKKNKGVIEANSAFAAKATLAEQGLEASKVGEKKGLLSFELTKKKVPRQELMHFSRQLAAFVRAGIPLVEAIDVMREEAPNPKLKSVLMEVLDAIRVGDTFSDAISAHPTVFPTFYVGIVRSAELTGRLDSVLDQVSKYIERDLEARRKIKSAMTYPAVIFAMSMVTIVVLTTFVLPRFKKFFEGLDAKLPLPTRMLLGAESFLAHWWWALLTGGITLTVSIFLYQKTDRGRVRRDKILLGLPVIGDAVRLAIIERFCRMLSSLVQAGVPLPEAMSVSARGTNNRIYEAALGSARDQMMQGEGISRPLAATHLFPGTVTQMVRVGEDTGTLDAQLETAASFYEQELDYKLKKVTGLFEPAVIVLMGLLVGFVAIALVSAMYGIFNQVGTA